MLCRVAPFFHHWMWPSCPARPFSTRVPMELVLFTEANWRARREGYRWSGRVIGIVYQELYQFVWRFKKWLSLLCFHPLSAFNISWLAFAQASWILFLPSFQSLPKEYPFFWWNNPKNSFLIQDLVKPLEFKMVSLLYPWAINCFLQNDTGKLEEIFPKGIYSMSLTCSMWRSPIGI